MAVSNEMNGRHTGTSDKPLSRAGEFKFPVVKGAPLNESVIGSQAVARQVDVRTHRLATFGDGIE